MNAPKVDEISHIIRMKIKDMVSTFAKSLQLDDQVSTMWLATQLATLAVVLQHSPPQFSTKVLITLLNTLPEDVIAEVVKHYIDYVVERYNIISQPKHE